MFLSVKWVGETHCTGVSEGIAGLGCGLSAPSHVAPGTLLGHYCLPCHTGRQRLGARLAPQGKSCPPLPQRVLPADPGRRTRRGPGTPWWRVGGSGRSLGAPSCGGSAGGTSWAPPTRPWAGPGRPGLGQHWRQAAAPGGPIRDPRAPGSTLPPPRPSPGLGAQPPEAQGGRRPSPLPVRGGHPQGRRQCTHQVEILLCVQVFHCERETHTINKQNTGAGAGDGGKEQTRNGGRKLEKEPSTRERAQQTCGEETGECKVRQLREIRRDAQNEAQRDRHSQEDNHRWTRGRETSPAAGRDPETPKAPRTPSLEHLKVGMAV